MEMVGGEEQERRDGDGWWRITGQSKWRRLVENNRADEMEMVGGEEQERRDGDGWWRRTGQTRWRWLVEITEQQM